MLPGPKELKPQPDSPPPAGSKKWFQGAHFRSEAHRRHARPEPWQSGSPDVICFVPRALLSGGAQIDTRQPVRKLFPIGADNLKRPFARPQRELVSEPHSEVSAPGLLPSYPPDLHRIRSSPMFRNAVPASTPLQGFLCPSGSKCSTGSAFQKLNLRKPPDLPSLPVARLHKMMTATDQRSRFATSQEAFYFYEPLGTRFIMRQNRAFRQLKIGFSMYFSSNSFLLKI